MNAIYKTQIETWTKLGKAASDAVAKLNRSQELKFCCDTQVSRGKNKVEKSSTPKRKVKTRRIRDGHHISKHPVREFTE